MMNSNDKYKDKSVKPSICLHMLGYHRTSSIAPISLKAKRVVAELELSVETQFTPDCPGQDNVQGTTTAPWIQYICLMLFLLYLLLFIQTTTHRSLDSNSQMADIYSISCGCPQSLSALTF